MNSRLHNLFHAQQDNVRTNTESVQCHHVFDTAYVASSLQGHVTSSNTCAHEDNSEPSRYFVEFYLRTLFYTVLHGEYDGKFIL